MIIENIQDIDDKKLINKRKYFKEGVIFDTCVLFVFFLDKYTKINPDKKLLLNSLNITSEQIDCLNTVITNLAISKIIITPHILSEFLNRIRSEFKSDYKEIKKECLEDLEKFGETPIQKNVLIRHKDFCEYGNDISLILANENQLKNFKYSCIMSFDGRFIENFFRKTDNKVLAFNLDTLQNYFT